MGRKPQPSNAPIPNFMVEEDRGLNPRGVSYDREYRDQLEAAKGVAQFGWESLPGVGTYYTVQDITEELEQENPNYMRIGMLAGTEVIGLIPGIGDAAANLIRKGAKFKTKRGSVYTVEDESRTTRERAPDTPDGDFVKQPTSGKTIYMSYEDMNRFGPLFQKGEPGLYQFRPSGEGKAQLVFTKDYGPHKAGDPVPDTEVSFTLEPELGMNPVEIYDSTNNARTSIHFGNEIVEVESDIPKVPRSQPDIAGNPQLDNAEYAEKMASFDVEDDVEAWKDNVKAFIKESRDVDPVVRTPELEDAAQKLLDKEITREEYLKVVDEYKPVTGWDQLPREPSTKAMVYSLKPNQVSGGSFVLSPEEAANLGVKESSLSIGDFFDGRLDVTAYKEFDTWIVAGAKTGEKGQHYAKAVHYEGGDGKPVILLNSDNPKKYETNIKTGERIGAAQQNPRGDTYGKTPYAAISGYVKDLDVENIRKQAEQLLNDPEWVQLGFDPRRQGNFYVRREKSNAPIHAVATSAEEVIQIGPLVLAKNPVLDLDYEGYNKGGMAMDEKADFESLEAYKEFLLSLDDIAEWRDEKGDKYSSSAKRRNTFSYPSRKKPAITRVEGVPLIISGNEVLKHKEYKDEYFSNNPSHEIIKADGTKDRKFSYDLSRASGAAEGATFLGALVAEFEVLANKESEDKISEKEQVLLDAYRVFLTERTGMNEGGMAMDEQMDAVFKSSRTGYARGGMDLDSVPENTMGIDPESGNEIPLGSLPEEVRDDIPAQLSEGEYVVPADVVRYYGVKFFEDLRAEAKFGYQDMNENGRIGGEPMGMETVEPEDDMMFDISELEVVDDESQPMQMNQGGYAESGGYALSPGDEGYDEMGSLGLGSEGLTLGTGEDATGGAVEMVAYVNDEGRVIYIMHINGVPQNEIPAGFYPRTEEENTQTSSSTGAQPVAQVVREVGSDYNDRLDDFETPMPKGVDYASLTTEEMFDMLEEQQSAKMDVLVGGAAVVNPIMGLFLKGAMVHQARQLEKEIERRLDGELTTQERTQLEGLLKQSKEGKPGLIRRVYGALKDEFTGEKETKGPEAYTPEVAAGSVTKALSPETMSQIEQAAKDAADPTQSQEYLEAARKAKEAREAAAAAAAAAQPQPPVSDGSYADDTGYSAAGTGDVLTAMRDRGASEAAITAAEDEAAKVKESLKDQSRGIQRGFKKGGLASKRGKKKK